MNFVLDAIEAQLKVVLIGEKHIRDTDKEYKHMVHIFRNLLSDHDMTYFRVFGDQRASQVFDLVRKIMPGWIAFEQKNKSFVERIFDNYNTKRLILKSELPVLVF